MGEEGGGGSLNDPDVMNDGLLLLNIHRLRDLLPTFFAAYTKKIMSDQSRCLLH